MFEIGDVVEWTSSSGGSAKTKRGKVEAVIPPKTVPMPAQSKEADAYGMPRRETSYLVRVPGKTAASVTKLYWPRTGLLRLIPAISAQNSAADEISQLRGLLDEVRSVFKRDDDLPGDLLQRIDRALAETAEKS